ncbi:phage recombination protein Bet [Salmonella enterica]|uniref:phage recombination protein Bet n=1 Tax=Salmonella TaxID=590 RepID=UPI0007CDD127|nr:phage recombination protein Bet [Salmonella enterica]RXY94996.1 phage recombination protein Bet [Salmonella sp. 3DZ2-4SM]HBC0366210.1 phage recombination protein Bet [Salmonella enterica subsp. enterica]ANF79357.1 phage recombination protein Bet [Salmonella enterica]MBM8718911.1 phage recombination protein Bet [Salmonella enterica]MBM9290221.1 phage recombination protein Bet [Salmonella enterica]
MSNEVTITAGALTDRGIDLATWSALKNSIYPGAKDESVMMALDYCRARQLDPLLKPVHLVPMSVKDSRTGKSEWRDVVMPGIGLYRIQADRSGDYAGAHEPEFGPDITQTLSGVEVTFPQWCKYTVCKRMPSGEIVEFSAKEYWLENYATGGRDTTAPNAMWKKRPYGQLAKCAEAQALRKAWPEIGQQPTAEEMEGKTLEVDMRDVTPRNAMDALPPGASDQTLQAITDLLSELGKDWEKDFLPLCSGIFKREILEASDLTEEEAQKGFSFLQKRAKAAA